jgi:drug/metabolite transporter (DMT)-like permease
MVTATSAVKRVMGPVEWGLLLLLALLWGGSFFFSKIAVGELPPLTVVLVRVALAALALNAILLLGGRRMPADARVWGALFVMGLLNSVVPFSLIF